MISSLARHRFIDLPFQPQPGDFMDALILSLVEHMESQSYIVKSTRPDVVYMSRTHAVLEISVAHPKWEGRRLGPLWGYATDDKLYIDCDFGFRSITMCYHDPAMLDYLDDYLRGAFAYCQETLY